MASDVSSMKDFLLGVGFRLDEPSVKKTVQGYKKADQAITASHKAESSRRTKIDKDEQDKRDEYFRKLRAELASTADLAVKSLAAVEGATVGITFAVERAAKSFERLNYLSRNAGSSPTAVTAFGYAAAQLGSSANVADASLQTFGQKLKLYPGYRQALERLGVKTTGSNGQLRDTADIATDLGDALRRVQQRGGQLGGARALAMASLYGFDDINQVQAMMDPRYRQKEAERRAQMAAIGANPNAAAAAGTAFEQSFRHLVSVIDDVSTKIEEKLANSLAPQLDALAKWATENGSRIADFVAQLAKGITDLAAAFVKSPAMQEALSGLLDGLEHLSKYVASDAFKKDIEDFARDIKDIAVAIKWGLTQLGIIPGSTSPAPGQVVPQHDYEGKVGAMSGPELAAAGSHRVGKAVASANAYAVIDPRWQARAFIAEGSAKPGDPLWDSEATRRGFAALMNSKGSFVTAKGGMGQIERFGPGEEGGRWGNANAWLPKVHETIQRALEAPATTGTVHGGMGTAPLGHSSSISNYRGDTNATLTNNFNITGPVDTSLRAARFMASRGWQDILRNMQGMVT